MNEENHKTSEVEIVVEQNLLKTTTNFEKSVVAFLLDFDFWRF